MGLNIIPEIHKPELRITANDMWPIPNDAIESFEFIAATRLQHDKW